MQITISIPDDSGDEGQEFYGYVISEATGLHQVQAKITAPAYLELKAAILGHVSDML